MGLRPYFRCMLLSLEAEMKPGVQKWGLPEKNEKQKTKRGSDQKRNFCSKDENLCK